MATRTTVPTPVLASVNPGYKNPYSKRPDMGTIMYRVLEAELARVASTVNNSLGF